MAQYGTLTIKKELFDKANALLKITDFSKMTAEQKALNPSQYQQILLGEVKFSDGNVMDIIIESNAKNYREHFALWDKHGIMLDEFDGRQGLTENMEFVFLSDQSGDKSSGYIVKVDFEKELVKDNDDYERE